MNPKPITANPSMGQEVLKALLNHGLEPGVPAIPASLGPPQPTLAKQVPEKVMHFLQFNHHVCDTNIGEPDQESPPPSPMRPMECMICGRSADLHYNRTCRRHVVVRVPFFHKKGLSSLQKDLHQMHGIEFNNVVIKNVGCICNKCAPRMMKNLERTKDYYHYPVSKTLDPSVLSKLIEDWTGTVMNA